MTGYLILAALVLFFVVIFKVAQTSDLLGFLKGDTEGRPTEDANNMNALLLLLFLVFGLPASIWSAYAVVDKFLPSPSSEHGKVIDSMFNTTLVLTGIVFILTQILLFWFAYRYREKKGKFGYFYPENNKLEIAWTVIPALVLTVLVVLGIESWTKITGPAPEDAVVVEVTGQQFNWIVRYPGEDQKLGQREFERLSGENSLGINFEDENSHDDFLPNEIHLVVNRPVMFKLGAKDVLHSFYLPHFRVKMDCVPGIPTQFWMTPTETTAEIRQRLNDPEYEFFLACAEFCGQAHWNMKYTIVVETEEEYKEWLEKQTPIYASFKDIYEDDAESETVDNNVPAIEVNSSISALNK